MNGRLFAAIFLILLAAGAARTRGAIDETTYRRVVAAKPQAGDVVFNRTAGPLFARVAQTSGSWTSHVGIIVDFRNGDWVVAESGVPVSRETPLRKFLNRSADCQFSIRRLSRAPTASQQEAIRAYAEAHLHETL